MTLSRQLITLIFITFMLIFSGIFWISVENTRSYLILQLATQTQNAANSLGLSLAPYMQNKDIAAMDTMINAVFDSGYYKSLKLETMQGKMLIERQNTSRIEGVPAWFINHLTLETPEAESVITSGWAQSGRLTLRAHSGYAYKKLWDMAVSMLRWSLLTCVLSLMAVLVILKAILRPLDAVERQALAIGEREFPIVENIPRTRELKRVVLAMNKMSAKVANLIGTLSERAEQLRQQAHYDALTGLINRRGFDARLDNVIRDKESAGFGALAVVRMKNLAAYNQRFGHQAGSALLVEIGKLLSRLAQPLHDATAARITGTDFAIILPLAHADAAAEFGALLHAGLNKLSATLKVDDIAHAGIACFGGDCQMGEVLSDSDAALSQAQHQGTNACSISEHGSEAMGNEAWKALITHAMAENHIHLLAQDVLNPERQRLYREVLIRVHDAAGEHVSPASFVSMAERLDMHVALDRYVIEQVTSFLELDASEHSRVGKVGINIAARSLGDAGFMSWLGTHFSDHKEAASLMCFEITEYGLLQYLDAGKCFIDLVHIYGGAVVMEHFGTRLSSFQTLRQLKLDYIKIDGSYIRNISEHSDNRFFLQTVTDIAHGLDVQVIAEHVETEKDFQSLKNLGINAMQGFCFGRPEPLA